MRLYWHYHSLSATWLLKDIAAGQGAGIVVYDGSMGDYIASVHWDAKRGYLIGSKSTAHFSTGRPARRWVFTSITRDIVAHAVQMLEGGRSGRTTAMMTNFYAICGGTS